MDRTTRRVRTADWMRRGRVSALTLLVGGSAACSFFDGLLEVDAPDQIVASTLNHPSNANLLVQSVIAEFECAFAGYIVTAGLHGDELEDTRDYAIWWRVDQRQVGEEGGLVASATTGTSCGSLATAPANPPIYTPMSTARFLADDVARKLEGWTDAEVAARQEKLATVYAYAGYAILHLAESYCSLALDGGPELTRAQAFTEAENRFTKALEAAQAANIAEYRNMALVGRARARLNLGNTAGVAADAALVPPGFVKEATYSAALPRRNNAVFYVHNLSEFAGVEADFRNLTVEGVPDSRVPVVNTGRVATGDRVTTFWLTSKYASLGSSIPIARYAEAQLMLAEVQGGQAAVDIVNAIRAGHGLPPYSGGTSPSEVRSLIIQERSRELFLEGQHLGDKLRYDLPFTPPAGTPYPAKAGGVYGSTTCFPLPLQEKQNNPNF